MRTRQIVNVIKNPFVILLTLVVFLLVGRWLILSLNFYEERPLENRLWQTVQQIKSSLINHSPTLSPLAFCHSRALIMLPQKSFFTRDSLEQALKNWTADLELNALTLSDSSIQFYSRNRCALLTAAYNLRRKRQPAARIRRAFTGRFCAGTGTLVAGSASTPAPIVSS